MKRKLGSAAVVAMFLALGGVAGVVIVQGMERLMPEGASLLDELLVFGLLLLAFDAIMAVQIAAHEAGHLVFGLMSGYRFVSYRIFGLMWLRDGDRTRFCRYKLAGTGGQCLMEPPGDAPEAEFPVLLYNLGGSLMNLICAALGFALAWALRGLPAAALALNLTGVVGVGYAVINGVPMTLNLVNNDGRNALELRRDPAARRAFWIQLKISALNSRGVRAKDMPEDWFALPDEAGMKNGLTASLAVFAANRLMDARRFDEAEALMERLLQNPGAMPGVYRTLLDSDLMYCKWTGATPPESEPEPDKARLKAMKALKNLPSVMRTEYALALLRDRDAAKAASVKKRFDALAQSYPYPVELEAERELMERAERRRED